MDGTEFVKSQKIVPCGETYDSKDIGQLRIEFQCLRNDGFVFSEIQETRYHA